MTEIPEKNYSPAWSDDTRRPPSPMGDERAILTGFLDWHRETFALKCQGAPADRLAEKTVPPSGLSLHGLVRHLAGVERWWFRLQFAGENLPMLYYSDDDPGQDFEFADGNFADDFAVWRAECEVSRRIVTEAASLDETGTRKRDGQPFTLRWLLVDLIAEYARHDGHADLIRERLDGRIGH
ncbi:MAG: DinB family protein [Pseudonocardiales bacterium]